MTESRKEASGPHSVTRAFARAEDWLVGGGEMGKVVRAMDWSRTPLGAIETWPQSLRTTVSLCLASNFPISLAWGPHHVQIYNDGYWPICGEKHPHSMGLSFRECWASAWPAVGESFERALEGETSYLENQRMFLDRNGYLEETFFTFSFSPIRDESGGVGGLFHPVTETTSRMISERRTRVLRDLAERAAKARTSEEAFQLCAAVLCESTLDLPFVLFYMLDTAAEKGRLVAFAGQAPGMPACPEVIDVKHVNGGWPLEDLMRTGQMQRIHDLQKRFGSLDCGPYPDSPKAALLLPITAPGAQTPFGFVIAGVSARLPLNESYLDFYHLLSVTVTAAAVNAQAMQAAHQRAAALAELDEAKTAFFSNVSHEFRTPLTLMIGPLEDELAETVQPLPGPRRERLAAAHRNSLRLLKLVNALLDFSRIEANRIQGSFEPVDLAAFTAELASMFRSAMDKAKLKLRIDCPPLPEPVFVDRDMWEKIVLNLLSNAFKHTFSGEISISLAWQGDHVRLSVRDSGIGIPDSELPRLFERFHRVRGARSRSHEGSGIGLALVSQLAAIHGGSVKVESREGVGSTFRVTIRTGSAHLPRERILAPSNLTSTATHASAYVQEAALWATPDSVPPPARQSSIPPGAGETVIERARILLVDDNADMRDYVGRLLGEHHDVVAARDGAAALQAALAEPPDLILSDVMMPGLNGFELLSALRADAKTSSVPVILLSARAGEESAIEGLRAGADDYLAKPFSARELLARVQKLLDSSRSRRRAAEEAQRKATMEAVRISEAKLRRVIGSAIVGVVVATLDGQVVQANDAYLRILGYGREDLAAGKVRREIITPSEWAATDEASVAELRETGTLPLREKEYIRKDGRRVPVLIGGAMVDQEYVGYVVDLSELHHARTQLRESQEALQRSEEQLRQSQKMEAIGLLAGGVAHDFNNLLSVILTCAEFALSDLPEGTKSRSDVEEIREAGQRAADLTRQLLQFSRQQIAAPRVIEPNQLLTSMHKLLERIVGEDIDLVAVTAATVGKVRIDPSCLEQVVLNLVVNARDAMPAGGKITIETADVVLDAGYADRYLGVEPGPYVMLAVSDTGTGMDKETQARIFEPFFTTKEKGRGTGLGLSTAFGIVQQSGGNIWVYSELGSGTTFKIYLPRVSDALDLPQSCPPSATLHGTETVLLVEDEDSVRAAARGILGRYGYRVIEARNASEALRSCEDTTLSIDLLLTDVVMPAMSGPSLAKRVAALRPNVKVLCMSGYTDDSVVRHGLMEGEIAFVQKPFTPDSLGRKVRELLDSN